MRTEHLVDALSRATVRAPGPDHVSIQPMTLHRDTRMALFQHPVSAVEFPPIRIGRGARLTFACGIKKGVWDRVRSPVRFDVAALVDGEPERALFSASLDPARRREDRRWDEHEVDLAALVGREVRLAFRTAVPNGDASYAWAGWGDPRLVHEGDAASLPAVRRGGAPLVVMISADALRADHLGCYGHPRVRTPHLDELARGGVRARHARAQTGTNVGSYTSLLTGQHVPTHGVEAEWGRVRPSLPTLPVYLRAFGYHTVFAASDTELCGRALGLGDLFAEEIPCLAHPGQDGSMTTRQWVEWLDRRPDRPCFAWIEYFDTHPPATPPEPFRSMYYEGDPTAAARAHRSEAVGRIRGVEVVQEIEQALPALRRGRADMTITEKLAATAAALRGGAGGSSPDLAEHLLGLGPAARRGLPPAPFADWLAVEVAEMQAGRVSREARQWLEQVLPMLKGIEADITAWLDGVVDFRYPLSQYMAGVSYFDHQVGAVVAALRERGLYDSSTLLVLAPHGEVLGEREVYFHHHTLMEASLRVPLIWKAAAGIARAGSEIDGTFDLIDVFPTLAEGLGLPVPRGLAGVSRWSSVRDGTDIPPHPSFAVNNHGSMLAVAHGGYKLLATARDHGVSSGWTWRAGDRALFDLGAEAPDAVDQAAARPDVVAALAAEIEAWRRGLP